MSNQQPLTPDPDQPTIYEIRIRERLGEQWQAWFDEGMTIEHTATGETLITAEIIDQAHLFGLLKKVRNLGLTLISVTRTNSEDSQ